MKFSIITPSYNQGNFIQQTIDSVINQTGDFDIEYFVMDGGSTDNTIEILKQTEQKIKGKSRFSFYWQSKKDKGQVDAINQGLSKATGDIIAYINSDDYYLPNAFNIVTKYFLDHPKSLWLVGNCRVSDPKLAWTFWLKHLCPIQYFKSALYFLNTINQPSAFLTKTIINKVGKFNPKYKLSFDHDYWLRCAQIILPGRILKNLSVFRIHSKSISNISYHLQLQQDRQIISNYTKTKPLIQLINQFFGTIVEFYYRFSK